MKLCKYRIATDAYLGYEIQYRFILCPFWISHWRTFSSIEEAEECYIKRFNQKVIKELN